jgi:hypothetical protein
MRKVTLALGIVAIVVAAVAATTAAAATPVSVSMTLTEPLKSGWPGSEPCRTSASPSTAAAVR